MAKPLPPLLRASPGRKEPQTLVPWSGRVGQVRCTAQQGLVLTMKRNRQNIKGPVNLREFRPGEAAAPGSCPEAASDIAGQSRPRAQPPAAALEMQGPPAVTPQRPSSPAITAHTEGRGTCLQPARGQRDMGAGHKGENPRFSQPSASPCASPS